MTTKRTLVSKKKPLLATLVTEVRSPCAFCQREVDDEITYGKQYAIGDIQCHYFCALLSCCLIQKGKDEEGLFGFMYPDIVAEVERCKKHRCSYCGKPGANLGCCLSHCRKQFHLPCGREHGAVSLFYGNYKSFCIEHAPRQKIPEHIMAPARLREKRAKAQAQKARNSLPSLKELQIDDGAASQADSESVCVICYEAVTGLATPGTFWPPCCARDKWFHRACLQRMALSAGMHYLKCPLCNDKEQFYEAVVDQGYYVPDRDAAWELEQNAFAEIYERPLACSADECSCPAGRSHDTDSGPWDIKLCILCGTLGIHAECLSDKGVRGRFVCATCSPQAPADIDALIHIIEREMLEEQARRATEATPRGPIMPSRMSLRRTKPRNTAVPSTSQSARRTEPAVRASPIRNTTSSRLELNLKTPRRVTTNADEVARSPTLMPMTLKIENCLLSPMKMLEQGFHEKIRGLGVKEMALTVDPDKVLDKLRQTWKPRPLSAKRRAVDSILEALFDNILKDMKNKNPIKEWNSPKKLLELPMKTEVIDVENKAPTDEIQQTDDQNHSDLNKTPKMFTEDKISDEKLNEIGNSPIGKILEIIDENSNDCFENEPEFAIKIRSELSEKVTPQKCNEISEISKMADELMQNKMADDDSSRSTFELPAEFIGNDSDEDASLIDTPKTLKTVDMEKNSRLEISENDAIVNIDIVKVKESSNKYFLNNLITKPKDDKLLFQFSPVDKDMLKDIKLNIDLESFKNHYLNEIGKDMTNLLTAINTADDTFLKDDKHRKRKRNAIHGDVVINKRRRKSKFEEKTDKSNTKPDKKEVLTEKMRKKKNMHKNIDLIFEGKSGSSTTEISAKTRKQHKKFALKFEEKSASGSGVEIVCSNEGGHSKETIDFTVDTENVKTAKRRKKLKSRRSRKEEKRGNIRVKIRLRDNGVKLRITKSKSHDENGDKKTKKKLRNSLMCPENPVKLKQYILRYPTEYSNTMICKPDTDVTPMKRAYLKLEKSPDNLVQTSIQSFFKVKP